VPSMALLLGDQGLDALACEVDHFCEFRDGRKRELRSPAALCRPPEKQGDHSKRINESVRQSAHPQVASAQHVSGSENEARYA
jgi:hypothetical protein